MVSGPPQTGFCPRCTPSEGGGVGAPQPVVLAHIEGGLSELGCGHCQGRFVDAHSAEVVLAHAGVDQGMLRDLVGHFSGTRLTCPGCSAQMHAVQLKGVPVDVCLSCGGLWLDAGELERVSAERFVEAHAPLVVQGALVDAHDVHDGSFAETEADAALVVSGSDVLDEAQSWVRGVFNWLRALDIPEEAPPAIVRDRGWLMLASTSLARMHHHSRYGTLRRRESGKRMGLTMVVLVAIAAGVMHFVR